jgi:coenzyme F420-reducing hydrogenase beta subunit
MNNIYKLSRNECCGCGVCQNVCPKDAIVMKSSRGGYLYPFVDEAHSCISCGLCVKACPSLNPKYRKDCDPPSFVVKASDDIRFKSSSGGAFRILAKHILNSGGKIVGAAYDGNCQPVLTIVDDIDGIDCVSGSKYIDAYPGDIYKRVEEILKKGDTVLFTGLPCQVAALNNFLDKDYENLFTVDLICHGALPYKMFIDYSKERFDEVPISAEFRNKELNGWGSGKIRFHFSDGRTEDCDDEIYLKIFATNLGARDSCLKCKFAEPPRQGDLSIGDYWNAKHISCDMDDGKGLSVITANSAKGLVLFNDVRNIFEDSFFVTYKDGLSWNRNKKYLSAPGNRERFLDLYDSTGKIFKSYDYCINWKYDVGIFGVVNNPNYGGLLTYYALYKTIQSLGYSVLMLNNPIRGEDTTSQNHSRKFFYEHTEISVQRTPSEQYKVNDHIDRVVLGSDQVWNYDLFRSWGMMLYLDFIESSKTILSYAASFGHDHHTIPPEKKSEVAVNLERFDNISVREREGVDILRNDFGLDSEFVLDPVFLMDTSEYDVLMKDSKMDVSKRYIGSYILNPKATYRLDILKDVSKRLNLKIRAMTDGDPRSFNGKRDTFKENGLDVLENITIEDWINVIRNSDFFVTDSFHASCICIMFKKKFLLIQNNWATSRLNTLMDLFGLQNRWVRINRYSEYIFDDAWLDPLDYVSIDTVWQREKKRCIGWLQESLKMGKRYDEKRIVVEPFNIDRLENIRRKSSFILAERNGDVVNITLNAGKNVFSKRLDDISIPCLKVKKKTIKMFKIRNEIDIVIKDDSWKSIYHINLDGDVILETDKEMNILHAIRLQNR